MKVNEGEVPQYNVQNSHEAIIDPEEWKAVQTEFERRKLLGRHYSGGSVLATRIVCRECGCFYGRKLWHANDKYHRTVWQCNNKFKGEERCSTPHLDEDDIKSRFLVAVSSLLPGKDALLEDCLLMKTVLTDCTEIDSKMDNLLRELDVISELTRRCIEENARSAQDQEEYAGRYNSYVDRFNAATKKVEALEKERDRRIGEADAIDAFIKEIAELETPLTEFDDHLWLVTVEKATVQPDGKLEFFFRGGSKVTV